jgi:ribosomal protein S18 acetylase RimI-like enzyme
MSSRRTEIKRLSDCSFADAVMAWNQGFQDYFVDMTRTLDGYLDRLHHEGLSPELSMIAFCDGKPAGFLLNGISGISGICGICASAVGKLAWNGGTGVAPEFRGRGVGKALVEAALDLYCAQKVELATLEAISDNEVAIRLYEQYGYEAIDRLVFLQHTGVLNSETFPTDDQRSYSIQAVAPFEVSRLDFYEHLVPWQTQWQSVARNHGEALIVVDRNPVPVGYALYQKNLDEQGRLAGIALYQCRATPGHEDGELIVAAALRYLFAPLESECRRSTSNLSHSNQTVLSLLRNAGFILYVEQVHMLKKL